MQNGSAWTRKSELISGFCVAARGTASRDDLATLFKDAVNQYQSEVKGIDQDVAIIDIANEIRTRIEGAVGTPFQELNGIFNWIHDNRNGLSISINDNINVISAADGVLAGLRKLNIEIPKYSTREAA